LQPSLNGGSRILQSLFRTPGNMRTVFPVRLIARTRRDDRKSFSLADAEMRMIRSAGI